MKLMWAQIGMFTFRAGFPPRALHLLAAVAAAQFSVKLVYSRAQFLIPLSKQLLREMD